MINKAAAGTIGRMLAGFGRPVAKAVKKQTVGRASKILDALVRRMGKGQLGKLMTRTSPIAISGAGKTVIERKPLRWAKALARRVKAQAGKRVTERTARRTGGAILGAGGYSAYRVGKGSAEKEAQPRTACDFAAALGAKLARRN